MNRNLTACTLVIAAACLVAPAASATIDHPGSAQVSLQGVGLASSTGTVHQFAYDYAYGYCSYEQAQSRWHAHGVAEGHWAAPRFLGSSINLAGDNGWDHAETYVVDLYQPGPAWPAPCGFDGDLLDQATQQAMARADYAISHYYAAYDGPFSGTARTNPGGASVSIEGTLSFMASGQFSSRDVSLDGLCGCAALTGQPG